MSYDSLTACLECGLLQRIPEVPPGGSAQCGRCGDTMHRNRPDSLNRTLALTIAGVVLFIVANSFPVLSFEMQGRETRTTLITGVVDLYQGGDWPIAAAVLFTGILAPGLQLVLLLSVLLPLTLNRMPPWLPRLFRRVRTLVPWGMLDVFMVGILVAVVKLADMAVIVPGASLFALGALIFVLAAAQAALDPDLVWSRVPIAGEPLRVRCAAARTISPAMSASWWCDPPKPCATASVCAVRVAQTCCIDANHKAFSAVGRC